MIKFNIMRKTSFLRETEGMRVFRKRKRDADASAEGQIIEAAYFLLAERGYANVSTREIASAAGVALSQLNYYFKTKDNLYRRIIDMAVRRIVDDLKSLLSGDSDRKKNFTLLIDYCKDMIARDTATMKLLLDFTVQAMWNKGIKIYIYGLFRELNLLVQKYIIKDDKDQKTFKGVPVDYVAEIAIYAVFGMTLHVILGKRDAYELNTEALAKMLFDDNVPITENV